MSLEVWTESELCISECQRCPPPRLGVQGLCEPCPCRWGQGLAVQPWEAEGEKQGSDSWKPFPRFSPVSSGSASRRAGLQLDSCVGRGRGVDCGVHFYFPLSGVRLSRNCRFCFVLSKKSIADLSASFFFLP